MTRFSVPYEEMEIIKIIIRVPSSLSLSPRLLSLSILFFSFYKQELVYALCL
jgi:hypothetical protein